MRVVITRGNFEEIMIWLTSDLESIVKFGNHYIDNFPLDDPFVDGGIQIRFLTFGRDEFRDFFGFTPRKGSKKVYTLTLKEFQKID